MNQAEFEMMWQCQEAPEQAYRRGFERSVLGYYLMQADAMRTDPDMLPIYIEEEHGIILGLAYHSITPANCEKTIQTIYDLNHYRFEGRDALPLAPAEFSNELIEQQKDAEFQNLYMVATGRQAGFVMTDGLDAGKRVIIATDLPDRLATNIDHETASDILKYLHGGSGLSLFCMMATPDQANQLLKRYYPEDYKRSLNYLKSFRWLDKNTLKSYNYELLSKLGTLAAKYFNALTKSPNNF